MRTTIDRAGRVVVPKVLRDQIGLSEGEIEVFVSGSGIHLEPLSTGQVEERDGRSVLAHGGFPMTDEDVRELRLADQR